MHVAWNRQSFGGKYPEGNSITVTDWTFEDLSGRAYTAAEGSLNTPAPQKMVWTKSNDGADSVLAPFYVNGDRAKVNVHAVLPRVAVAEGWVMA